MDGQDDDVPLGRQKTASRADPGLKIAVGRVLRPHGVNGEVKFIPFFDGMPDVLEGTAVELATETGASPITATALHFRGSGRTIIAKFEGFDDPESARLITNRVARVERRLMPDLPDGNYYYEEIVGLPVHGEDGARIGTLKDFFAAGEKDVWEIQTPDGGEILLPCLPETLLDVDLERGIITVRLMETID